MEIEIVRVVQKCDGVSRKALAGMTGHSQATITNITKMLIERNYVVEGDRVSSGRGRKEVLLYLNPEKFKFLGLDIGGYRIRFALADNLMRITHEREYLVDEFNEQSDILESLLEKIEQFLIDSQWNPEELDGIGIAVTGIVDKERQRVVNIPNLNTWGELDIVSRLNDRFGCRVYLDESGRTMALAEKAEGKAKDVEDFTVVHIAYGIVAGIMINGQLLRGANNVGGLLGHVTVDENAGRCMCGNYGCLENMVTYPRIESDYKEQGGTFESIVEAYQVHDKIALDVCIASGNAIGIALSNVINLFNPSVIYLGGPVFEHLPIIFEETKRTILLRANRYAAVDMKLEQSSFGHKQGMIGALSLVRNALIS
ncbi:ROK family protein [Paenibacillus sp. J5C_2022]|nr:ROK family protein [Paenibacillus sp. J5C2022]